MPTKARTQPLCQVRQDIANWCKFPRAALPVGGPTGMSLAAHQLAMSCPATPAGHAMK
jgi:hypothetical protein